MTQRVDRERWEAVRKEEDLAKAIHMLADLGEEAVIESVKDRETMQQQIVQVLKILVGNGDPSHSLINRVDDVETTVTGCKKILDNLQRVLIGDLNGAGKETSIIERVKHNERITQTMIKISWIVLTIVVGELAATLIRLIGG